MKPMTWWMRGVGGFYLLLAALNLPPLVASRLPTQYPTLALVPGSGEAGAIVDLWFLFGAELGVVGAALLWFSRSPRSARPLVATVLWLEVVRGIAMDLYWVGRGLYNPAFYAGFAALHAVIVGFGIWALRHGSAARRLAGSSPA